jgi:hypothetical protein
MTFGLGLPPHKYVLDKLGAALRSSYEYLIVAGEPTHFRALLKQLDDRLP